MSVMLFGRAWFIPVDSSSKLTLLSLCDHANDEGKSVYPSIAYTELRTSLNRRTIQRCLAHLEAHELLQATKNRHGGATSTEWEINAQLMRLIADHVETSWKERKEGVTPSHPWWEGGDICDREGCHLVMGGVTPRHPIRDLTVREPAADLLSTRNPRHQGESFDAYLARLALLRKEA